MADYNSILKKSKNFFLVGIGGAGMSAIAQVLKGMGLEVSGSDIKESRYTSVLKSKNIKIFIGHSGKNIRGADIVVYSAAIPESNPEIIAARSKRIPVLARSDILAWILNTRRGIAISGTHGKTTTTSMIALILRAMGLDPIIMVGGELNELGSNARYGKGEFVIAEACESDGSFLKYKPFISVVTNIEGDHFDYYSDIEEIKSSFKKFISYTKPGGFVVMNGDEDYLKDFKKIFKSDDRKVVYYGTGPDNYIYAEDIKFFNFTSSYNLVFSRGRNKGRVKINLNVPGVHNVKNSLAALAVCNLLELDMGEAANILKLFTGVKRRFEKRGEKKGALIIDDYAHHPSEVKATLQAAADNKNKRVIMVFQPHRYSRLANLKDKFNGCFDAGDILIVTDVYGSGEQPIPGITGKILVDSLIDNGFGRKIIYIPKLKDVTEYLELNMKRNDMVLLMGAGDITRVTDEILKH
ncbi:MAG: UDP-N-acetylmuramate--L-alanine ligase [Actinomycetota bacterium]|nr:UDP-N-acetylmuramate--L-alanine ligase [Actinomycetota bacterium]